MPCEYCFVTRPVKLLYRMCEVAGFNRAGYYRFLDPEKPAPADMVSPVPGMIALTIAAIGDLGSRGPFWSLPGRFLTSSASAGGIALINTIGALGGFVGPYAVGVVKDATGSFTGGLLLLAALLFVSAIATLRMRTAPALAELPVRAEPAVS